MSAGCLCRLPKQNTVAAYFKLCYFLSSCCCGAERSGSNILETLLQLCAFSYFALVCSAGKHRKFDCLFAFSARPSEGAAKGADSSIT